MTDETAEWLTQSALRLQMCIAMSTLSRAEGHGFDFRSRPFQGRFLWFPSFSGECRSMYKAKACRSPVPKLPQHRPVDLSGGARRREMKTKILVSITALGHLCCTKEPTEGGIGNRRELFPDLKDVF